MVNESDWKLFRKKLPGWQARYMQRMLDDYAKIIASQGLPSDRFWTLQKRLKSDVRLTGVRTEISRSLMHLNISRLWAEGAITIEDLQDFSNDMKQFVSSLPKKFR